MADKFNEHEMDIPDPAAGRWHLSKRIDIGIIIVLVGQSLLGAYALGQQGGQIAQNTADIKEIADTAKPFATQLTRLEVLIDQLEKQSRDLKDDIRRERDGRNGAPAR